MCLLYIICTSNPRNNIFACHQQKRYLYIAFGQVSKYWSKYTYPTPRDDVQMYETWWTFIHIALISLILVHISSFISPGRLTAISHTWTHKYVFLPLVSRGDKYFATYTRAYIPHKTNFCCYYFLRVSFVSSSSALLLLLHRLEIHIRGSEISTTASHISDIDVASSSKSHLI